MHLDHDHPAADPESAVVDSLRALLADLPDDAPEPSFRATLSVPIEAVVHVAREGGFWAEVPSLPGCVTEGETLDEIRANIIEAATGWLAANQDAAPAGAIQ